MQTESEKKETNSEKNVMRKISIILSVVVICLLFLSFVVGVEYGQVRGVEHATSWYEDEYIPEKCSCYDRVDGKERYKEEPFFVIEKLDINLDN